MANSGRTPELSIKVTIDPVIDRNKLQGDINKLIPESKPININAAIDAEKLLKSISTYQANGQHDVPIVAKISNVDKMLDIFNGKPFDIALSATTTSIDHIKGQLQNAIDALDFSNIKLGKTKKTAIPANVTLNVEQTEIDNLKSKIETRINPINATVDVTDKNINAIKAKIEKVLNSVGFKPQLQNQNSSSSGSGGKGGNLQSAKMRELERNLVEQARVRNKQDDALKSKRYRVAATHNTRISDLQSEESNIRFDLSKINPNYQNEASYDKVTAKVKYVRNEHTNLQKDKEDLEIIQKLNAELNKNIILREELNKINPTSEPIKYADKKNEIEISNSQINTLGQKASQTGISLGETWSAYQSRLKELNEEFNNQLLDAYEKAIEEVRKAGARKVAAVGKTDRYSTDNIPNEYNKSLSNVYAIDQEITNQGLYGTQRYRDLNSKFINTIQDVSDAITEQANAQQRLNEVDDEAIRKIGQVSSRLKGYKQRFESSDIGINSSDYSFTSEWANRVADLYTTLDSNQGADKNQIAQNWAQKYNITDINSLADAYQRIQKEANKADQAVRKFSNDATMERADIQASIQVQNLQSQLHDYLEKYPKVNKVLSSEVKELEDGLAEPNAFKDVKKLSLQMAELRSQAKAMGVESENLIDKFENLLGQHLSTMITMAALHKMQAALRIIYQNVVDIDTAMTELRKVTNLTAAGYEKFMERASEQAQQLGVSISDIINSTADWSRLGYSEKDAENLATYSTLLKNVGDGIDDVNTSSSYLISTLQGFGLLANDAEDVVNKIDAVANTQPITANDIGEILTRSSAAMAAANNTLEETIALGTAANSVIQDADTVGTTLKTLSMYLRAAKTDAEAAGIEVDGMADSVSKLRSELKALTGVDIMLDSKNFKSTYQIMKEISEVWGSLSDVTQANVTEMLAGKRNANAVSSILNNFNVAESSMESAANSANVAWEENEKYLDSIQGRLNQLDASFQSLSVDFLNDDLVKNAISLANALTKGADAIIKIGGAAPTTAFFTILISQLARPKYDGFQMIVASNTSGGDTEQACGAITCVRW